MDSKSDTVSGKPEGMEPVLVSVESALRMRNLEPYVILTIGSEDAHMPAAQARAVAYSMLEAAECGLQEAALYSFVHSRISKDAAASMLNEYKEYRSKWLLTQDWSKDLGEYQAAMAREALGRRADGATDGKA